MNILDLCFFRSIQSLALESTPNTLKELILSVERDYDAYQAKNLAKASVPLQTVLVEVMKEGGGNRYKIKHMGKDKILKEGPLPKALPCDGELYQRTLELIAGE